MAAHSLGNCIANASTNKLAIARVAFAICDLQMRVLSVCSCTRWHKVAHVSIVYATRRIKDAVSVP
jgi:hypothetical protein